MELFPMSHGNTNVGGSPNGNGTMAVSYASALKSNHHSPSPTPTRMKKCETFFRNETIPEGMNLHVKSPVPQTLVFTLPRKDSNPDEILTLILNTYTYVDSFHHRTLPTTVQFFITVDETAHYELIRQHPGLTVNGRTFAPVVPAPTSRELWRVNFRFAPHSLTVEDFVRIFEPHGEIAEIGRYYYAIQNSTRKIYTWDGYVMLQGKMDNGRPVKCNPVPETLDIGYGISISTKTASTIPNTPNSTSSTCNTTTNHTRPGASVNNSKPQPKAKSRKRNGKKRQKAVQQDNAMEGVISTGIPEEHHQQEAHTTGSQISDSTLGTQAVASVTPPTELASTPPVDGSPHALAPRESGTSTGSTNNLLPSLHSLNASSGSEQPFFDAVEHPASDHPQDNMVTVNTSNASTKPTIATGRQPRSTAYAGSYNVAQLSQTSIRPTNL